MNKQDEQQYKFMRIGKNNIEIAPKKLQRYTRTKI